MKKITVLLFLTPFIIFAQQKSTYKVAVIAFYNLENFYDTIDNPLVNDDEFTPNGPRNYNSNIYWNKVEKLATVIAQLGTDTSPDGPAILGVSEIENDTVLNDLIHHPLLKARNYKFVHYDSKDARGVDVALIYNPKYFTPIASKPLFVALPGGSKNGYYTRDILWVKGNFDGDTIHVLVNHWPSRLGGEERSAPSRAAAAAVCKAQMAKILDTAPNAKFIIMGDLNDDPTSSSITKVLNAKATMDEVKPGGIYNPWTNLYKKGIGTLAYQDAWGLFDQIMINYPWLTRAQTGYTFYKPYIFNKPLVVENIGKYKGYPMRTWDGLTYRGGYSDHFPTYLVMVKKVK